MAKSLTITAVVIAVLMLVLFGLDLAIKIPFGGRSMLMDICFLICGVGVGLLGFSVWCELD